MEKRQQEYKVDNHLSVSETVIQRLSCNMYKFITCQLIICHDLNPPLNSEITDSVVNINVECKHSIITGNVISFPEADVITLLSLEMLA